MKVSKFQIIFLSVMVAFIVAGVIAFATYKNSSSNNQVPPITVWGTYPKASFDQYVVKVNATLASQFDITYVQKDPSSFLSEFVSALARGAGPDAVLIPADLLLPTEDKLTAIPYAALPSRTFMNTYIDESSIYLAPTGVIAIPFAVDPLVMYWNRDTFNAAGVALPPRYWDEFSSLSNKITVKDQNGTITKSAVAMGDFSNVANAREVLATLLMQIGNPITAEAADGSYVQTTIKTSAKVDPTPALQFFTGFVDPSNPSYSWNKSWPNSKTAFLSGNLATYFGLASELSDIRAKNPNLNFDVAAIPQTRSGGTPATYGKLYGLSIVRSSPNAAAAYTIISTLTESANLTTLSSLSYSPSVSRVVIAGGSTDPYITLFNQSALIAKTWLDASPDQSNQIFGNMISALTSGQKNIYQAIADAGSQYDLALQQALGK